MARVTSCLRGRSGDGAGPAAHPPGGEVLHHRADALAAAALGRRRADLACQPEVVPLGPALGDLPVLVAVDRDPGDDRVNAGRSQPGELASMGALASPANDD